MSTKIVSKNSSQIVLQNKTGYFTGMDGFAVVGIPLVSNVISFLAIAVPVSNIPGWDIPTSILTGILAGTGLPFLGGKYWNAYQTNEALREFTGTTLVKKRHRAAGKTFLNSLLPFGQTFKTGSKVVKTQNAPAKLIGGSGPAHDYYSYRSNSGETYTADTYLKFTPLGSVIKQVITPTPITVWDDAFKSTLTVHEFD
jgi:hypothetical protein